MLDAVIVGAGAAGLSSALVLGRSRRQTLVLDAGAPRNAPSPAAHSFFTRDGAPPAELLAIGRDQLLPYPTVTVRAGRAVDARALPGGFEVSLEEGDTVRSRKLLLAYGVVDDLPPIEGLRELWGTSVLHCPFCHGWEVRDEPLAVYGRGEMGFDFTRLILGWSRDLVLCTGGPAELTAEQREGLTRNGVVIREEPIVSLASRDGVLERIVFADGSELPRRAMFVRPAQRPSSDLADRLGCEATELGLVRTDEWGHTSVPGVYAAGDLTTPMQQVIRAAALGAS
ncbi:MAG TPA: NAD(P)/FAD-dependent oxidoreductase, partial [Thermoanaerobaculia bacterium]|nr:NAD(P)/FAD-dependent oxidoreductase [Thermoanaerobaculia bacterium]